MKRWKILAGLLAALALNSCLTGGGGTEAEGLSGQFVDLHGTPLAKAVVKVYGIDTGSALAKTARASESYLDSTSTDAQGRFAFPNLKDGRYSLQGALQQNGALQTILISSIQLQGGVDLGVDTLRIAGSILIRAQSNGVPLAGVECYIPGSSFLAVSDDSGRCLITGVPPGSFQVRLQYSGLQTDTSVSLQVQSDVTTNAGTVTLVADPAFAPPQPTGLSAKYDSVSGVVTLSWKSVQVSDLAGYVVYRRQDLTEAPEKISLNLVVDTVFKDTLPQNGNGGNLLLFYQVKAQDKNGNLSDVYSDPVAVVAAAPQQGHYFSLNTSTVALWTFNSRKNGLFTDQSAGAFNLSGAGSFTLASSPYDSAAVFTGAAGAGTFASIASNGALTMAGTGKLTYEARVYLTQYPSAGNETQTSVVIGTYEGVRLEILNDGSLQAGGQKTSGGNGYWYSAKSAAAVVPLNRWVDLAVAFDQATGESYGYVDESPVQLYATPNADPFRVSTTDLAVGNNPTDLTQPFKGQIDEIRISNNLVLGTGLPLIATPVVPPSSDTSHFEKTSSTMALWTFDAHNNGTFSDLSSNALNLSNAGNFGLAASPFDSASVFTGSATLAKSYLTHAHASALTLGSTGQITYEVRVYLAAGQSGAGSGGGWLLGTYDGVNLALGADGFIDAAGQKVRNGTGYWISERSASGIIPQNRWVDLAVAFDQATGQVYGYVDGKPVQLYSTGTANPITDPFRVSTGDFFVGNDGQDQSFQFSGQIDELRVSNSLVLGPGLPLIVGNPP